MSIKTLLVDNQWITYCGLQHGLAESPVTLIGQAKDAKQTHEAIRKQRPAIVLLETHLGDVDGYQLLEEIAERSGAPGVIVFSAHDTSTQIARAAALGAKEFLRKSSPCALIVRTIEAIYDNRLADPSLIREYQSSLRRARTETEGNVPLTNREIQVLRHVAMGLSNREIGKSLEISIETVKEHVQNILRKLDVNDRTQAAVWAVRRNMI
jgi:DNA-binding NarL/FixJ family response regulator